MAVGTAAHRITDTASLFAVQKDIKLLKYTFWNATWWVCAVAIYLSLARTNF